MVGWRRVIWPLGLLVVGCIAELTAQMNATAQSAEHVDAKFFQDLRWRSIGPARAGRVVAVTGVRGESETYYFGSVGGGVWKTNDAGRTWNPIFDSQPVASIGAIATAPSNPEIIYVGSGEADMRSSISTGNGMYKSTDGGKTWANIGLADSRQIGRIPRTQSAGSFVRMTVEKTGCAFYSKTKIPARSISRSNRVTHKQFTPRFGKRAVRPGAFIRLRMARAAACIVRQMAAIIGNRLPVTGFPPRVWAASE